MSLFKKFKEFFFKPDVDDHYIIEKWKKESDEADRIKELHRQSRKQEQKPTHKQKNKTLSSNF